MEAADEREEAAMDATTIDPAAEDAQVYDLDLIVCREAGARTELRVAPYPLEPTAWFERLCPKCHELYGDELETCPLDGHVLREVLVSRPFLWLG
jgi:hypothetical protein